MTEGEKSDRGGEGNKEVEERGNKEVEKRGIRGLRKEKIGVEERKGGKGEQAVMESKGIKAMRR